MGGHEGEHTEFVPEEGTKVRDMVDVVAGVDVGRSSGEIVEDVAPVAEGFGSGREFPFGREHERILQEFGETAGCSFLVEEGKVGVVEVEDVVVLVHSLDGGS